MIVIRPILRWLGIPPVPIMQTTKTIHYVFDMDKPQHTPKWVVSQYISFLVKGKHDPCYPSRLDELSSCKITKLELYKEKKGLYHEFVLAYIEHSSFDESGKKQVQTRVALLERIPKPIASTYDLTVKTLKNNSPAIDSIAIYETSMEACASRDAYCCYVVKFSQAENKVNPQTNDNPTSSNNNPTSSNDNPNANYTHSRPPNILDLAVAADTLSTLAEQYSLFNTMCYWFANNLCRLLAQGRDYTVKLEEISKQYGAGYYKSIPALASDGRITLCRSLSAEVLSPEARAEVVKLNNSQSVIAPDSQEPSDASQFASHHFSKSATITDNYYPKFLELHSKHLTRLNEADEAYNRQLLEAKAAKEKAQREVREKDEELKKTQKESREKDEELKKTQKESREKDEKLREKDEKLREKDEELERLRAALQMQSASSKEAGGSSAGPSSLAAQ